ncbi:MAG: UDP-4-amino-4,6-dideoxy-N-acetyl-beta-L-altrosamine transaminase [Magnetospirillum sp. WYHS-4]
MTDFLPYGRHVVEDDDIAAVAAALRGELLTTGPAVAAFEAALAKTVGASGAVSCSSGTAALHLAALALGLGPGDWVVVPAITFLATANAARYVGAEVQFADVDPDSGLMRPEDLEVALAAAKAAGRRVKAVFPVHLAGQACDMEAIAAIARREGGAVVEDACHALGTTYGNGAWRVGGCAHADMTVFSFHPVKTVAMGEGGAVTANDPALAARLALLRSHGMVREPRDFIRRDLAFGPDGEVNPWFYEMAEPGFNYRASDLQCALGLSQLGKLDRFVAARAAAVAAYDARLAPLAPRLASLARVPGCRPGWHLYISLIDFAAIGKDRGAVMRALRDRGIGTQVHYIPVAWQAYYRDRYGETPLPGSARYYERCLSLPLSAAITEADVQRVTAALAEVLA